ncbi:SDR family oxidoreductase [Embleya sp. NPDC005575]|uniref:SDR family NAD(P)-dependent oxidoreductase n=1 Tax=Embleya sp. NPDC005575 TaxID=3156892 RepID=UPI0033B8ABA1
MAKRFEGRRALITGASRGIGAALAVRLAAEGADVAVTARTLRQGNLAGSLERTETLIARHGRRSAVVVADLSDEAQRARIVPAAEDGLGGPIDILVNNAAMASYASLRVYPQRRARLHFEVNVLAPMELCQAVVPAMAGRGEGWIVNVSSGTARPWAGPPFEPGVLGTKTAVYGASKAALNRITNALAAELYGTGIRVNTIEPRAAVLSEGAEELVGGQLRPDQIETMDQMVSATLELCDGPASRTGGEYVSLDLLAELGIRV